MTEAIEIYNGAPFKVMNGEIWATQKDMVIAFDSSKANISEHITDILQSGELERVEVVRNFRTTASCTSSPSLKIFVICSLTFAFDD